MRQLVKNDAKKSSWDKAHLGIVITAALCAAALSNFASMDAEAQGVPQLTLIATGLNSPRGLAFGPNGTLYVAEAGLGAGNGNGGIGLGVGLTGSITAIKGTASDHPTAKRLVTGLASVGDNATGSTTAVGPDGLSVQGNGGIFVIMAESTAGILAGDPEADPSIAVQFGWLVKFSASGQPLAVADVGDFSYAWTGANALQPWAPAGQFPDANPYGVLALPGRQYVVDAGANTLNEVRPDGSVRLIAYFPNPQLGDVVISDGVPTCVAQGPDGFLYVGTLALAINRGHPNHSKVYRVNPTLSDQFLTDADVWADGFNPITGCAFGADAFYVVEFTAGDVVRVALHPDGSAGDRTALGVGALRQPNGIAVGPDGSVYVSNHSVSSGGGEVVRVNY